MDGAQVAKTDQAIAHFTPMAKYLAGVREALLDEGFERDEAFSLTADWFGRIGGRFNNEEDEDA